MIAIPLNPTGEQLYAAIVQLAGARGVTPNEVAAPLGRHPHRRLEQLRGAKVPKPATIAKIKALIEGDPLAAVPTIQRTGVRAAGPKVAIDGTTKNDPPLRPPAPRRTACPWCATRADMHAAFGCNRRWE